MCTEGKKVLLSSLPKMHFIQNNPLCTFVNVVRFFNLFFYTRTYLMCTKIAP